MQKDYKKYPDFTPSAYVDVIFEVDGRLTSWHNDFSPQQTNTAWTTSDISTLG